MTAETQTIALRRTGQTVPVIVTAKSTANGNLSFEYAGMRHILTQDGRVLQMIRYAYGSPSWESSPVLTLDHDATQEAVAENSGEPASPHSP